MVPLVTAVYKMADEAMLKLYQIQTQNLSARQKSEIRDNMMKQKDGLNLSLNIINLLS